MTDLTNNKKRTLTEFYNAESKDVGRKRAKLTEPTKDNGKIVNLKESTRGMKKAKKANNEAD